jgi:hypothetical protein
MAKRTKRVRVKGYTRTQPRKGAKPRRRVRVKGHSRRVKR